MVAEGWTLHLLVGLSISYNIIHDFGGSIRAENRNPGTMGARALRRDPAASGGRSRSGGRMSAGRVILITYIPWLSTVVPTYFMGPEIIVK